MQQFKSLSFEAWTDGERRMCSIRAEITAEDAKGIKRLSFYMTDSELRNLVGRGLRSARDGYIMLEAVGELWTFVDLEAILYQNETCAQVGTKFLKVQVPHYFTKLLLRLAAGAWSQGSATKKNAEFSQKRLANIARIWGFGKGEVELRSQGQAIEPESKIGELLATDKMFSRALESPLRLARNSTRSIFQKAVVSCYLDREETMLEWCAYKPNGDRIMNGGIVKRVLSGCAHIREERTKATPLVPAHDWSCHT